MIFQGVTNALNGSQTYSISVKNEFSHVNIKPSRMESDTIKRYLGSQISHKGLCIRPNT